MSPQHHVPDDLLTSFVDGELGTHVAVHVAEHIDSCPACATRAASLEPLALAFAATDDPVVPEDLAEAILEHLHDESPVAAPLPSLELAVGGGLLCASAALAAVTQHPLTAFADPAAVASAGHALLKGLAAGIGPFATVATLGALFSALGGALTIRMAPLQEV
jgi:anti-sigma factor RsiW